MRMSFRLAQRNIYPWTFLAIVLTMVLGWRLALPDWSSWFASPEFLLSAVGALTAFFHFLYTQHNHDTERFMELFSGFNCRYDKLNEDLNVIAQKGSDALLTMHDRQKLSDYFNLCAEEYLYYQSGYIDADVWGSWLRGMKHFAGNESIRKLWVEELAMNAHYGFRLKLIDELD